MIHKAMRMCVKVQIRAGPAQSMRKRDRQKKCEAKETRRGEKRACRESRHIHNLSTEYLAIVKRTRKAVFSLFVRGEKRKIYIKYILI